MIRALITGVVARYRARRRYFQAQDETGWDEFIAPDSDWLSRWDTLSSMAGGEQVMSDNAFGFAWADERDEDGFTIAQSHSMAGLLLNLVADTEMAQHWIGEYHPTWDRHRTSFADDPAVLAVLMRLSEETAIPRRAELTLALYDATVRYVGGQAAEALAAVARFYYVLSGMSHAEAAGRVYSPRPSGGESS